MAYHHIVDNRTDVIAINAQDEEFPPLEFVSRETPLSWAPLSFIPDDPVVEKKKKPSSIQLPPNGKSDLIMCQLLAEQANMLLIAKQKEQDAFFLREQDQFWNNDENDDLFFIYLLSNHNLVHQLPRPSNVPPHLQEYWKPSK